MTYKCDVCKKTVSAELVTLKDGIGMCPECKDKHEKSFTTNHLGMFDIKSNSTGFAYGKPHVTGEIDIHQLIDDAMEKKDRCVMIYIGEAGTTVHINPYDDKPLEWIERKTGTIDNPYFHIDYECPSCGYYVRIKSPYCPFCGEKLKLPSQKEE